jgi:hypothetical protein
MDREFPSADNELATSPSSERVETAVDTHDDQKAERQELSSRAW